MGNRKLTAAVLAAGIAGGGVAGLVLGTPALSLAQAAGPTTTVDAPAPDPTHPGGRPDKAHGHRGGPDLEVAAAALGMSQDDLRTALRDGRSIADVAEEKGVDVQKVIDALVADGSKRLDEAKAELPERAAEAVNRAGGPGRSGRGGHGGPGEHGRARGAIHARIEAAAGALGMSEDDLRTALRGGKSLADLAGEKHVPVQTVVDALVKDATTRIDEAVADGKLTADQATSIKDKLVERVTELVDDTRPGGGKGGPAGRRGGR